MMGCIRESGVPICGWKYPIEINVGPWEKTSLGSDKPMTESHEVNNPGFWEVSEVITRGLNDNYYDGIVIKVNALGLVKSDPQFINRAIFMDRDPEAVAKSWCKVRHSDVRNVDKALPIIKARRTAALAWLRDNRIPTYRIQYEDLLRKPIVIMKRVNSYLGRGDYRWGAKYVKPKYDHSKQPVGGWDEKG